MASVHIHDAKVGDTRTRLEVAGTEGDLAIVATGSWQAAQIQVGELRLQGIQEPGGSWQDLPIPDRYRRVPNAVPGVGVLNVAQLYAVTADDIRTGGRSTPDFEAGLQSHRLLDVIRRSAKTGCRQSLPG